MTCVKTVLICMCERCGYGRADHPKTMGKPWVAGVRPQYCEECGSPYWDAPRKIGAQITVPVESRVGCIEYALGFRRMLRRLHIELPTTRARHSTRSPRSRIDLAEKPIPRHQTYAEPRFRILIERLGVRVGAIFAKSALNIWIRIRSMQRFS
jgi:hypothetical protein